MATKTIDTIFRGCQSPGWLHYAPTWDRETWGPVDCPSQTAQLSKVHPTPASPAPPAAASKCVFPTTCRAGQISQQAPAAGMSQHIIEAMHQLRW